MEPQPPPPIESTVVTEAVQLRSMGPGKVWVLPTTSTEFNAVLTSTRATLDDDARQRIKRALLETEKAVQGIAGASSTASPKPIVTESTWKTILRIVLWPQSFLYSGGETTAQSTHNRMVAESGVGAVPSPVPRGLLKAAEGRLVALAAGETLDTETSNQLSLPWQSVTVGH